jgi:2'-5' RNA ligase
MQFAFDFPVFDVQKRSPRPSRPSLNGDACGRAQMGLPGIGTPAEETIFFALHPPADAADIACRTVGDFASAHGLVGRFLARDRLHVSLLCLCKRSSLTQEVIDAAVAAARSVRIKPFEIGFDRISRFGRDGVDGQVRNWPVVLRGGKHDQLQALYGILCDALERANIINSRRIAFVPHMTMFYGNVGSINEMISPVNWTVGRFSLIRSFHGASRHEICETFELR